MIYTVLSRFPVPHAQGIPDRQSVHLWFHDHVLPGLIFEDEHILVFNKPPGLNTHAPSPYAGEGLYDWLRHREPRWENLAIIHRLDKETSGVILFGKTALANRSLTKQFAKRTVRKIYLFLTDRAAPQKPITVRSDLRRVGDKYVFRPPLAGQQPAETKFEPAFDPALFGPLTGTASGNASPHQVRAKPLTGRTHQIRVHAAQKGFPILGDVLYGGSPARRVYLHAAELVIRHPASSEEIKFEAPPDFATDPIYALRDALIEQESTNAYRLVHGASDGAPNWYIDRLGDYVLSQHEQPLNSTLRAELGIISQRLSSRSAYHKVLSKQVRCSHRAGASPQLVQGQAAAPVFVVRENGLQFELSFEEGYSVGLFLDQRDNRRRLLNRHVAARFPLLCAADRQEGVAGQPESRPALLNTFAYTCGFSLCAAKSGFVTTSLDLSKKYLEWGKRNFLRNYVDPQQHQFIHGDVFDWLRRLTKQRRAFQVILLDPPTFSQSKLSGVFRADQDYSSLVKAALPLLQPGGVLFCSTNAARWRPEEFLAGIEAAANASGKRILQKHYAPQPPDFPVSRAEPAYLKTVWLKVE
ncbi:MAG TPA: pseudouridine synthase [Candidatus Limnocylindrales bacterium]|nr:pseudouridine synthase [Candidatus Limnocylindrales bacterium]